MRPTDSLRHLAHTSHKRPSCAACDVPYLLAVHHAAVRYWTRRHALQFFNLTAPPSLFPFFPQLAHTPAGSSATAMQVISHQRPSARGCLLCFLHTMHRPACCRRCRLLSATLLTRPSSPLVVLGSLVSVGLPPPVFIRTTWSFIFYSLLNP